MRSSIFKTRLYNQIVLPLLLASLVIGIVAAGVSIYFLSRLSERWSGDVAEAATASMAARLQAEADSLQRIADMAAAEPEVRSAVASGEGTSVVAALEPRLAATGYDAMFVARSDGVVEESTGPFVLVQGEPLTTADKRPIQPEAPVFINVRGTYLLVALSRLGPGHGARLLGVARAVDDTFLSHLAGDEDEAYCFYDRDGNWAACTSRARTDKEAAVLEIAEEQFQPEITALLRAADPGRPQDTTLRIGEDVYHVWVRSLDLGRNADPREEGYLVGYLNQNAHTEADNAMMSLIAMSSILAVAALVGFGGWIARRVSDPLAALADGARRVADGDFSWKAEVSGANEISELADSFNQMTDSLRDRSQSLTKKVLELATLYEMSRSFSSTLDLDQLLESVLDSALRIFDVDRGHVILRDRETGVITVRASAGIIDEASIASRGSMAEWVIREGRPLLFNPDSGDPSRVDPLTGAHAALSVPLISPEGPIGAITVGSDETDYRFTSDDVRLLSTIGNHVTIAIGNIELFSSLQDAYLATVRSLAAAVDAKDAYTRGHSDRVATYAIAIAEALGLSHEQRMALEISAYLHDIGKIGVSEEILLKPGRLTDVEMSQMRHHPLIGANILKPVTFPWPITPVVRHHHEHWDGSGYPAGLRGEEIPLLARILTVADSFEAMTADRPYREGRSIEEAVEELQRCAGTHFDPRIVEIFSEIMLSTDGEIEVSEDPLADLAPEEARAVFATLFDGVLASFRRLAGPRLASSVEEELRLRFRENDLPFDVERGRVVFLTDPPIAWDEDAALQREALRRLDATVARLSGGTLVDHFYADAMQTMSAHMRELAVALDFAPAS